MSATGRQSIRFTLNGVAYELSREQVVTTLSGVVPGQIRKHAVLVDGVWFPAIQAFEVATGIPRADFVSHTARRHLAALGFEVRGEIDSRTDPLPRELGRPSGGSRPVDSVSASGEWHTEANVQAALVTALAGEGWRILSVANTLTKEHGIDVIATSSDGVTAGVEVKGFPSRSYADPNRAGEPKRTSPSTQAGHWFSQAVLAAMRLRGKEPNWRSVISLGTGPSTPRPGVRFVRRASSSGGWTRLVRCRVRATRRPMLTGPSRERDASCLTGEQQTAASVIGCDLTDECRASVPQWAGAPDGAARRGRRARCDHRAAR